MPSTWLFRHKRLRRSLNGSTWSTQERSLIPTTGLTALQGIDDALHVKKGKNIVIHGAAGGIGTLAVQFAKLRGARVFATASSDDRLAFVRGLGADIAVNRKREDIVGATQRFAPDGIDAVLGLAGGARLSAAWMRSERAGGLLSQMRSIPNRGSVAKSK